MMMEAIQDLSMETGEMPVVLSALRRVRERIREVSETHRPLFSGEHFLTGKEVCERLYISPRTLQDYRDRKVIPYTQFAGKILYKASDLERIWKRITGAEWKLKGRCESNDTPQTNRGARTRRTWSASNNQLKKYAGDCGPFNQNGFCSQSLFARISEYGMANCHALSSAD